MSAGSDADAALTEANRAAFLLVLMVVKRRLTRAWLEAALSHLETAAALIRKALGP